MFVLKLFDRNGKPLQPGDIVQISDGRRFRFWSEVKFLEKDQVIAPFHTFSFHSFEKVDNVPANAIKSTDERYNIWYVYEEDSQEDKAANAHENYLTEWRQCEHLIDKRMWRIEENPTE